MFLHAFELFLFSDEQPFPGVPPFCDFLVPLRHTFLPPDAFSATVSRAIRFPPSLFVCPGAVSPFSHRVIDLLPFFPLLFFFSYELPSLPPSLSQYVLFS